ncbi:NSFL1 cofactor p47-like isoform X2 [Physella acuta]|uniref:NSFL1 cofactor p47-like isoform X2 n=1 Tax=Physella acuta TaxID=109671 RepID=UPI0027DDE939|nr:NSFL1 cofactor p47-like isoform X2 [Physella acuta]
MADRDSLVDEFVNVTGVDKSRARFYLESSAWNLELAMSSFFEGTDNENVNERDFPAVADVSLPTDTRNNQPSASVTTDSNQRIKTISSMHVESDSSEEEGQAYYAGGSDTSGQQVLGPPKKKDSNRLVESLFKSAREHGAEEKKEDSQMRQGGRATFIGAGYRLGETQDDTTVVAGASHPSRSRAQVGKKLKFWKDGFSIDDGPLRDYNDPENKDFLDSISRGEVPHDLIREAKGGEVNLDMEDHRAEEYVKPKHSVKAFSGAGHMLGSPTPTVIRSTPQAGDRLPPTVEIDADKPVTNIQLRLADGQRMVVKLNHSNTISDIRHHIIQLYPQYAERSFSLMTTFPNKELVDESQTLEQANLLNAVVVQKLK